MSRTFLTFGDIAGKLHMLRIECTRCACRGQYSVVLSSSLSTATAARPFAHVGPKRNVAQLHERCDLICPDLPKML
jgi:hypothetical protein